MAAEVVHGGAIRLSIVSKIVSRPAIEGNVASPLLSRSESTTRQHTIERPDKKAPCISAWKMVINL